MSHYELILQSTGDGIYGVDLTGNTTFANFAALKMLARAETEIVGRPFHEILFLSADPENLYDPDSCPIQYVLNGGDIAHVNKESFYFSDGASFLVEYICLPMTAENETVGAVITFQNVTERHDLEAAAARIRETALETARLKAAFLANISHELRTPLSGILGTSDLLLETKLDAAQLHYVEMLRHSAGSLLHLVNDILDFSKAEAGKIELEKMIFDLPGKLKNTIDFFAVEARRKNLFLTLEIGAGVPVLVRGDAGRLRQIFNNLIGNSIKFTSSGGIKVRVETLTETASETVLRFFIEDTGIGIPIDAQNKLFQPFAQADASTTRQFGGTGLGLAICKELVQIMGGEIGLESEPDAGSTFWFTVPFENVAGQSQPDVISIHSDERQDIYRRPQMTVETHVAALNTQTAKILVAEDNAINQEIAVKMLEQLGFQVDAVSNGAEAVAAVTERDYDAILMDCQMPFVDGYEAAAQIRFRETGKKNRTPIVAMTANVLPAEIEKCLASGMNGYLSKPFTRETLAAVLEKFKRQSPTIAPIAELTKIELLESVLVNPALDNLLEMERSGEPNFVVEILTLYLGHADEQIETLRAQIKLRSVAPARIAAHSLKGSSGNIGAAKIYELCGKIEDYLETAEWNNCTAAVAQIEEQIHNVKEVWSQLKNS